MSFDTVQGPLLFIFLIVCIFNKVAVVDIPEGVFERTYIQLSYDVS